VLVEVWRETERLGIRGAMGAVVGARREAVEAALEQLRGEGKPVWVGNVNASTQFVLTGASDAVAAALDALRPRALSVLPLTMTWPIHSELMLPVADAIGPRIAALATIRDPAVPYYGPEGRPVKDGAEVRLLLGTAFCHPTLWKDTFERMVADGARAFVEAGPGEMLTKMVRWIDRTTRCVPAGSLEAIRAAVDIVGRS
jgi:[acyl-carrier-protein] S-malonyltransferase